MHTCVRDKNGEGDAAYKIKIGLVPSYLKEGDIAVLFGKMNWHLYVDISKLIMSDNIIYR